MANPIEKSRFWWTHYIFSRFVRSFCTWHFLENMFKRCRFWRKCFRKIKRLKNPKKSILTWKSKIVSQPDIVFAQLTHSDIRQIIFSAFWNYIFLVLFRYIFGIFPVQNFFLPLYDAEMELTPHSPDMWQDADKPL